MTGGHGADAVRSFYETWFIGHWPEDTKITLVSRTAGESQLVDELILSFTHDCEMPTILPGIKPTGRKVTVPTVVIVGFDQDDKITHEHIYWDQATMLVQLGLSIHRRCPSPAPSRPRGCSIQSFPPTR